MQNALRLKKRHQISYWDAAILAAAISPSFWWLALEGHKTKGVFAKALQNR
jgi:predicted nucleic acid-binding protein